ncbi:MAG TPA: PEP-CTERM sorting domain-containing protein [Bryobacteraceae bacterium]|nr:PEP-CTERM sorting domain-containing protein [Bryobacteraceae bacterium]
MLKLTRSASGLVQAGAFFMLLAGSAPAEATQFKLRYTGAFSAADALNPTGAVADNFDAQTGFVLEALFDDASPNLAAPVGVPGFVAYAPSSAKLTFGGSTYDVLGSDNQNLAVAVFDKTTPFGTGFYGVGMFVDPVLDGAGFVGDFSGADPEFTAANLKPTVFTGYNGAGFLPGFTNNPGVSVPWVIRDANNSAWDLTFTFRTEQAADGAPLHTATLTQVPEPGTYALAGTALLGLAVALRRRGRS